MELLKLIKNRISSEWKKTFNDNVDILNRNAHDQDQKLDTTNSRIDNLVLHSGGDSPNEVVDARVNNKGESFNTLQSRLLAAENKHDADVDELDVMQDAQQNQLEQLNNSIGKLMGTYGAVIDYYVSAGSGNDRNGDGTETNPFATIQMAINQIPLISSSKITIWVDDGVYLENILLTNVSCTSFSLRCRQSVDSIDLSKNDLPVKVRSFGFVSCNGYFQLYGIQAVDLVNANLTDGIKCAFYCKLGGYLALNKVKISENTKGISNYNAIYANGNSKINIYQSYFSNQSILVHAALMSDVLFLGTNSGSSNSVGIISDSGAMVTDASSTTAGSTTRYQVSLGMIMSQGQVFS